MLFQILLEGILRKFTLNFEVMEYHCLIFLKYLVFQMKNLVFQSKF